MEILTEAGQRVFDARLAARDDHGKVIETFPLAVERLARVAATAEKDGVLGWHEQFKEVLIKRWLVPSTPIWANMGKTDRAWQPAACFVLDVEDSLRSMYVTLAQTAEVFKSGGGVGYNFSKIRPAGDLVRSTKGKASGVVELIRLYNASSQMVMQGGVRRGASMGVLDVSHPEICEFIQCKLDGSMTNFNLSVGVTDDFMNAVLDNSSWNLEFNGRIYRTLQAKEIWDLIVECAWKCGDPGLLFLDTIQKYNPVPYKEIKASNPCGELPLYPGESCLLASVNLANMVRDDNDDINWTRLTYTVEMGVRFLDNIMDKAHYPLPHIKEHTLSSRKIGLGITGLHDALIRLGLPYDSRDGIKVAAEIQEYIKKTATEYSSHLGATKGNFPDWHHSIFARDNIPRRNASCITIAPTGSVTTLAGCEGYGIEPIFAVAYTKKTEVAGDFEVFSPLFLDACRKHQVTQEVLSEVARRGTCQGVEGVPQEIQRLFKGAQDLNPTDHLMMQVALQKEVDNAISKTINLPNDAASKTIRKIYMEAWAFELKGITVFRDGCKEGVVTVGEGPSGDQSVVLRRGEVRPRPVKTTGQTDCLETGCGKIYLTVNVDDQGFPVETFITTGSSGGCLVYTNAASRLISLALRGGISIEDICEQLNSTHPCPSYQHAKGRGKQLSPGGSCASAIAQKLAEVAKKLHQAQEQKAPIRSILAPNQCPSCGENNAYFMAEGCRTCKECGYSKC